MFPRLVLVLLATVLSDRAGARLHSTWTNPPTSTPARSTDEENDNVLIVELRLRSKVKNASFPAMLVNKGLYLPFRALCDEFGIKWEMNGPHTRLSALLPLPEGVMELDMASDRAQLNGKPLGPGSAQLKEFDGDIYVNTALLEAWLPLRFTFSYSRLELDAIPTKQLPIEVQWQREAARAALATSAQARVPLAVARKPAYKLFSAPYLDLTMTSFLGQGSPGRPHSARQTNYQIDGSGDLLFMTANWSVTGTSADPFKTARLQLSQSDIEPRLLGQLHARSFAIGDLWFPTVPLFAHTRQGRGFAVSSFPANRTADLSRTSVAGYTKPAWEVELYRNGQLIDFHVAGSNGGYLFNDVPLVLGKNDFRIVAYGPNGQVTEEKRHIFIGPKMAAKNQKIYLVTVLQQNESLLLDNSGLADASGKGKLSWMANYEQGLTASSTFSAYAAGVNFEGQHRDYVSAGLRQSLGQAYGSFDLLADSRGGFGAYGAIQATVNSVNVSADAGIFQGGFVSELVGHVGRPILFQTHLRADGTVSLAPTIPMSYSISLNHFVEADGVNNTLLAGRFATNIANTLYSATMRVGHGPNGDTTIPGVISARKRIGKLWYRAELGYSLGGESLQSAGLSLDWSVSRDFRQHLGIRTEFGSGGETMIETSLNRHMRDVSLGANLAYGTRTGISIGISISTAIGPDPRTAKWNGEPYGVTTAGLVSVRAFIDINGSGKFDAGDKPLSGVRFLVGRRRLERATDAEGVALLSGLNPGQAADLRLDFASLEDPTLAPIADGITVVPRVGSPTLLDFPMVQAGQIEGMVVADKQGKPSPVFGVCLKLLNLAGQTVDRTTTAFDGGFFFDLVRPGSYSIVVDADEAAKVGLAGETLNGISIRPENRFVSGATINLKAVGG